MTLAIVYAGVADPMAMLLGLQGRLRDSGTETSETDARVNGVRADAAEAAQAESLKKAIEAAEKALKKMPRWLRKTIGAVLSAVGAVASVVTGGASVALTVVGVMLMVGAEVVEQLTNAGIIPEKAGMIVATALKVASAVVMSFGAGAASAASDVGVQTANMASSAASTAASAAGGAAAAAAAGATAASTASNVVVNTVSNIASYIELAVATDTMVRDIQNGVVQHRATNHRLDAAEHALVAEESNEHIELAHEAMVALMQQHQRIAKQIRNLVSLRHEAQNASTQVLA